MGSSIKFLRDIFFRFLKKVFTASETKYLITNTLKGLLRDRITIPITVITQIQPAYPELGQAQKEEDKPEKQSPIFITARFRTGSTLLWNIFRNIESCTAYYEPFNERRWFDPLSRGTKVDPTHCYTTNYWQEYEHLKILSRYYREEWIEKNLYMDRRFWDINMKRYVELLIENAPGRPVLQFNRIDFRLPWFRQNFPTAKIIHLYRNPRTQWCSALRDLKAFPKEGNMSDFSKCDKFYLLPWARDLKYYFPFLDESFVTHPYQLFYYIWKLSYLFGIMHAHYALTYEQLLTDPHSCLLKLFRFFNICEDKVGDLVSLINKTSLSKWENYATDQWFKRHETICENTLKNFLSSGQAELR